MQRLKHIFLSLLIAACMGITAVSSVFAADAEQLEQFRQQTERLIQEFGAMDDAELEEMISYYEMLGDKVAVDGFRSLQALKQETGDFVAVNSSEVKETPDGITVSAQAAFGDRTATVQFGMDPGMNELKIFHFEKNETLGEKLKGAAFNLIVGMGTVFLVLVFIAWIISRFKYINEWVTLKEKVEKEEKEYQAKVAAAKKLPAVAKDVSKRIPAQMILNAQIPEGTTIERIYEPGEEPEAVVQEAAPAGLDPQLIAVLAAAVAAAEGPDAQLVAVMTAAIQAFQGDDPGPDGLIVRSIRRLPKKRVRNAY